MQGDRDVRAADHALDVEGARAVEEVHVRPDPIDRDMAARTIGQLDRDIARQIRLAHGEFHTLLVARLHRVNHHHVADRLVIRTGNSAVDIESTRLLQALVALLRQVPRRVHPVRVAERVRDGNAREPRNAPAYRNDHGLLGYRGDLAHIHRRHGTLARSLHRAHDLEDVLVLVVARVDCVPRDGYGLLLPGGTHDVDVIGQGWLEAGLDERCRTAHLANLLHAHRSLYLDVGILDDARDDVLARRAEPLLGSLALVRIPRDPCLVERPIREGYGRGVDGTQRG